MIDPVLLRTDPDLLRRAMQRRAVDVDVDALIELDRRRREVRTRAEQLRAEQKQRGAAIAKLQGDEKQAAIADTKRLAEEYQALVEEADRLDEAFMAAWVELPNLPDDTAPDGTTEDDAVEVKRWGSQTTFGFDPLDHKQLGEGLDIIDTERAAKVSGSRFGYVKGQGVLLELGLVRWAMDTVQSHGFVPMIPPVLVRERALFGTGFFPADREQVYAIEQDDLYLVGTSEVPLAAYHDEEILDELPLRYAGFSTCFRREAGTYGKDTAGIFRVHQFDKVEMFSFVEPEASKEEHERILAIEEHFAQQLELPYRVVNVAAGDLGASAAKKYDIEAWFPSMGRYREITSCSNTTDYQARRLRIRYRSESGNRLVHTLNGTAIAVGRTILAILENHQQADGSVVVPEAIRPYVGFDVIGP